MAIRVDRRQDLQITLNEVRMNWILPLALIQQGKSLGWPKSQGAFLPCISKQRYGQNREPGGPNPISHSCDSGQQNSRINVVCTYKGARTRRTGLKRLRFIVKTGYQGAWSPFSLQPSVTVLKDFVKLKLAQRLRDLACVSLSRLCQECWCSPYSSVCLHFKA